MYKQQNHVMIKPFRLLVTAALLGASAATPALSLAPAPAAARNVPVQKPTVDGNFDGTQSVYAANADGDRALDTLGPGSTGDLPPGATSDWWATVQEDIRQSEYHVTWQERTCLADLEAAYQAPNRAHNLRTYFTPAGVRLIPRVFEGETPPWEWGLTLTGYGYAGDARPVAEASLTADTNRIDYERDLLTEWYENDERGLEQGFTLHTPPSPYQGEGARG